MKAAAQLPVSVTVIVVVAVLALCAYLWFFGEAQGQLEPTFKIGQLRSCCNSYMLSQCQEPVFDTELKCKIDKETITIGELALKVNVDPVDLKNWCCMASSDESTE